VQRIDEKAVCKQPAPGSQQGTAADAVRASSEHDAADCQRKRGDDQREKGEQPPQALFGQYSHEGAVGRILDTGIELSRPDPYRVVLGKLDSGPLSAESLSVIALELGPLLEEVCLPGRRNDRHSNSSGSGDDGD
jgi:hypothetical protein